MLRSLLFAIVFYSTTTVMLIGSLPLLAGPRHWAMAALRRHALVSLWLLEKIVGTRMEVRGREHLPQGAALIAAKHQSAWDTFALIPLLDDPALIMKRELKRIPIYGWFSAKFEMIFVDRSAGAERLAADGA